jgi:lipopolysaccharide export LptBFGC system permease protein LptF
MKYLFLLLLLPVFFGNCRKAKEQIQENLVIRAMTDGQWRMTKFVKAGGDITADFAPYRFQFHKNNTVEAINNGTTEKTGSWSANPTARTISSTFTNATATVMLLNGTWLITKNSWTFVEATQTVNGQVLSLRLDK